MNDVLESRNVTAPGIRREHQGTAGVLVGVAAAAETKLALAVRRNARMNERANVVSET